MKEPVSVIARAPKVTKCLDQICAILEEHLRGDTTHDEDAAFRPRSLNRLRLSPQWAEADSQSLRSISERYLALAQGFIDYLRDDTYRANRDDVCEAVFEFLEKALVRQPHERRCGYRPHLSLVIDQLPNPQAAEARITSALEQLQMPANDGVYFYADFYPFSKLLLAGDLPYMHFVQLVRQIQRSLFDREGWMVDFRGSDSIKGFLPNPAIALEFLTRGIHVLTSNILKNVLGGWNIGAARGGARVLLGAHQPVEAIMTAATLQKRAVDESKSEKAGGRPVYGGVLCVCQNLWDSAKFDLPDIDFLPGRGKLDVPYGYHIWRRTVQP